jgi:cellulose synthase operon protein C
MSAKKPGGTDSVPIIPIASAAGEACHRVDRVAEYLDGSLDAASQEELLDHLPTCEACQQALHGEVQLRDREDEMRLAEQTRRHLSEAAAATAATAATDSDAAPATALTTASAPTLAPAARPAPTADDELAGRRAKKGRWRLSLVVAPLATAAAAAALFLSGPARIAPGVATLPAGEPLALAPNRATEVRLSWRGAAGHRPYVPMRSSSVAPGELIDPEAIARLSRAGDCAGLAAAYILSGELMRAQQQYAAPGCGGNLELTADRAALAVAQGEYDDALTLADEVLAERPHHPVALWNRALALRELGLGLAAAAAFDRVATIDGDAGWRAEAKQQAASAKAPLEEARRNWELLLKLGPEMIPDGPILPLELVRAVPGRARIRFHDAVRTATTAERLEALRPLARELEGRAGQGLERVIDDAKRALRPGRAALVQTYADVFHGRIPEEASLRRWKAAARAAGAADLLLGVEYYLDRTSPETHRLARAASAASGDPWFAGISAGEQVRARLDAGDLAGASEQLAELEGACQPQGPGARYLCLLAAVRRAELLQEQNPAEGAAAAKQAVQAATADGEFAFRSIAALHVANNERMRGAFALARGYYEERELSLSRDAADCGQRQHALARIAILSFDQHRFDEVQRVMATVERCDGKLNDALLMLQTDMIDAGLPVDRTAWAQDLARNAAEEGKSLSQRLTLAYLAERGALRSDPAARERMAEVIARVIEVDDSTAERARVAGETSLVVDAGRRGQWKEALRIAATAHGVPVPERCSLALASDAFQLAAVVASSTGEVSGIFQQDVGATRSWQKPASLRQALEGCPQITALAFPPWLSESPLAPELSWSFAMGAAPAGAAPPAKDERLVIVSNSTPPPTLRLPSLTSRPSEAGAIALTGEAATIARVATEAARATLLEFHVHTAKVPESDAPALALSDDGRRWALTAETVSRWKLEKAPVVLLADCAGARPAEYMHLAWGLPAAFRKAGARAVVASLVDIPDGEGGEFFAQIRKELRADSNIAAVVARLRAAKLATDPASWVRHVVVFQ